MSTRGPCAVNNSTPTKLILTKTNMRLTWSVSNEVANMVVDMEVDKVVDEVADMVVDNVHWT